MTTIKIKCTCGYPNCKARIVIGDSNYLYVIDDFGKSSNSALLPRPIAKAIRDACKIMEDNDVT